MIKTFFVTSRWRLVRLQYRCYSSQQTARRANPLRILFCGSDQFSIKSLESLHKLHKQDASLIKSIDVLCRTDKRTGRGLKTISQVPIKSVAQDLDIPVHQIDTFKNWALPSTCEQINLIVAVSFGLLIPSELISQAKYGGLNVHPSLLPDLRGAAPIHHALLLRRPVTGVSIQTLHPTKFDQGQVLDRVQYPLHQDTSFGRVREDLASQGALLLERVIKNGLFVPPTSPLSLSENEIEVVTGGQGLAKAPKIQKSDLKIDWNNMTAEDIQLRWHVFGPLWDDSILDKLNPSKAGTRVMFNEIRCPNDLNIATDKLQQFNPGDAFLHSDDGSTHVLIKAACNTVLEVLNCNFAGDARQGGGSMEKLKNAIRSHRESVQ